MIKVTTVHGKVYEGELFAIDPVTKSLSIKNAAGTYTVINSHHVSQVTGSLTEGKAADFTKLGVHGVEDLENREQAALRQIEKNMENVNLSVSSDIQLIFDRFCTIYPTKWKQNSIVILEEYIIEPPYETVKVLPGKEGTALSRLSSTLQNAKRKQQTS